MNTIMLMGNINESVNGGVVYIDCMGDIVDG